MSPDRRGDRRPKPSPTTRTMPEEDADPVTDARRAVRGLEHEAVAAPRRNRYWALAAIVAALVIAIAGAGTAIVIAEQTSQEQAAAVSTGAIADSRAATLPVLRAALDVDNQQIAARNLGPGFPAPEGATTDDYRRRLGAADAVLYLADLFAARGTPVAGDSQPEPGHVGTGSGAGGLIVPLPNTDGIVGSAAGRAATPAPAAPSAPGAATSAPRAPVGGGGSPATSVPRGSGSAGATSPPPGTAGGKGSGETSPAPASPPRGGLLPLLPPLLPLPGLNVTVGL